MKRIFTFTAALVFAASLLGQAPSSFKYQAVLRDARGNIKANILTNIIISILQGGATGTTVYSETHSATTDGYGLINLEIGKGTATIGTLSGINWGTGTYYVKVTVDGTEMGTAQLLSVPYALYASKTGNGFSGSYNDLTNKPVLFDGTWLSLSGKPALASVATSGNYNDLSNKPSLFDGTWSTLTGKPSLAPVATSGNYNDLNNKPAVFDGTVKKLAVTGETTNMEEALFEVKNKNGQTVFAVYNEGVRIYVDDGAKGTKGGFAIGGFSTAKAPAQNYFVVNSDSIRAYINSNPGKSTKGGFAIGGFDQSKAVNEEYLLVTRDSTRVSFDDSAVKGTKGGFAIGGFDQSKGGIQDLLTINTNSIRMYLNDNTAKGTKGGFAIGGFDNGKALSQDYLLVTHDSTRVFFNNDIVKGTKGGFAIGGFSTAKGSGNDYLLISPDSTNFYVGSQNSEVTSSFNIVSFDPDLGWQSLMTANSDTINMTGVLSLENDFSVDGDINYGGTVARDTVPDLMTSDATDITKTTATSGGDIISNGGAAIIVSGICWSTSPNPTISNNKTSDGESTGSFSSPITGLTFNTTYFVRAYATNTVGTGYGNEIFFTTSPEIPTLSTSVIIDITNTTATSGGVITGDGGASVYDRGVCWSTIIHPTTADYTAPDGSEMSTFISSLTGLTENTTYFVRAYATNSAGTAYGNELSFTTTNAVPVLATLFTIPASSITQTTATSGGEVISDGGGTVTERGICWRTTTNPTITDSKTSDGTGLGIFSSVLTGLTADTTYYVRAYATNSAGTAYGDEISFTAASAALAIGQLYQGGIIAYILQPGDPGYFAGQTHGLIAAPTDQSLGIQWSNGSFIATGATATALGAGNVNTSIIISYQGAGSYAAQLCSDLVIDVYSDWYLPSKDELNKLYLNKAAIGGFANFGYWSSTEFLMGLAWHQDFVNGGQADFIKDALLRVRAVRAF